MGISLSGQGHIIFENIGKENFAQYGTFKDTKTLITYNLSGLQLIFSTLALYGHLCNIRTFEHIKLQPL